MIGSAGSPDNVRYLLDELGFDAAFDSHDGQLVERPRHAAPDGIDVYFDNVGGPRTRDQLNAGHTSTGNVSPQ
ncbi:hypothetical protein [Frankia nepalensis]|uniref:hypothetical protein n=1 Tax=Frankia nepalensis TaxID=1836974 RepID=UPI0038995FD0